MNVLLRTACRILPSDRGLMLPVLVLVLLVSQAGASDVVTLKPGGDDLSLQMKAALKSLPEGGTIRLPAGEYVVRSELDPAGVDKITIAGAGPRTVIRFDQRYFGREHRWIHNLTDGHDDWTLRDFTFDGMDRYSPRVCDRDKIIKLRGDRFLIERVRVQNEAGRGFATILGDDQRWLHCDFHRIGTRAGDSSVIHPGNRSRMARRVLVLGCTANLGTAKVTFLDAVVSDMTVSNNIVHGGKTGVILSWWGGEPENVVISGNILLSNGRACRATRQRNNNSQMQSVVITNNVMTGPLENQFGRGFVGGGNSLRPPAGR